MLLERTDCDSVVKRSMNVVMYSDGLFVRYEERARDGMPADTSATHLAAAVQPSSSAD
jgi:hypothetical protein